MTRNMLIALAGAGSAALLLGALGFQYLGELAPCKLCIWQRWPHLAAVLIALAALAVRLRVLSWLGAAAALTTAGIGFYHVGVEQKWWEGPTTCSSSGVGGLSTDELMEQIFAAPLVQCDQIAWELLGISMAGWNGLASLVLAGLWIVAARR